MPVDDKDFYHMQAHMHFQDEKLLKMKEEFKEDTQEIKTDIKEMKQQLAELINHMNQNKGSHRTSIFYAGLFGAILAGISEYILYYVLQK